MGAQAVRGEEPIPNTFLFARSVIDPVIREAPWLPSTMAFRKPTKAQSAIKKPAVTKAIVRKVMKTKRVTKVAHGRLAKALVLKGRKEKTSGGLTKDMLMINRRGKIVSKRASAHGRRHYKQVEDWTEAVMGARDILRLRLHSRVHRCSLGAPYNVAT